MTTLEAQVKQLGLQAVQDCERMAKDRTLTVQLLHKVSLSLLLDPVWNALYVIGNRHGGSAS